MDLVDNRELVTPTQSYPLPRHKIVYMLTSMWPCTTLTWVIAELATPLSRPQDVVLHIGMDKTGTSSIQFFLRDNRARLRDLGVLLPVTPGKVRHDRLGLFVKSEWETRGTLAWARQSESDLESFRSVFRRKLLKEIVDAGLSRVLFTDEALWATSEPGQGRLRSFTDQIANSVRVVAYLRRQDDHLLGRYQQAVKTGGRLRLRDWAQRDMSRIYDYHARLGQFERLLAPTDLVVRRFERDSFVGGSLYQDFLDAAGIDACADDLEHRGDRNQSLDVESVEFLRLFNLYRVENEGAISGLIDNRNITERLSNASHGPVLSLPANVLDEFMAQWAEPNELVARRFLRDPSGQLFRMPRKTENISTEQRLDPARLDHFFSLLEFPEQLHAPLRRLAEREATNL